MIDWVALAKRDHKILLERATGKTFRAIAKSLDYNISGGGVSCVWWREYHRCQQRMLFQQRTSTAEDVYMETEILRYTDIGKITKYRGYWKRRKPRRMPVETPTG